MSRWRTRPTSGCSARSGTALRMAAAVGVGTIVGMVGGKQGTALGLLLGVLYAVGMSWFS